MSRAALVASLAAGTLWTSGCSPAVPCGPSQGTVAEVLDGDTVKLESGETVRYLLVDAPEYDADGSECYGPEARDFNRQLVRGRQVALSYGPACEDRFGRLLATLTVDGHDVNALLVERGYACVLAIPPVDETRAASLESTQAAARAAGRGLWGNCAAAPCGN